MDVEAQRPPDGRARRKPERTRLPVTALTALLCAATLSAQTAAPELRQILDRLEGLERANRELTEEVRALRSQLAAGNSTPKVEAQGEEQPAVEEELAVQKQEIHEQAQTKVESSQRFPIRLKGMLLFNTFLNSKQGGEIQYPAVAAHRGDANGGATLRQSLFGFDYAGPEVAGGGKLHASLLMDFYGGSGQALDQSLRIRTADVRIDWKSRGVMLGIDKPIFAPRDPASLGQVGVSPLTGAGNLWMWIPQIRFEQTFHLSDVSLVRAQFGIVQTREIPSYQASDYVAEVEGARPGAEGRVEFSRSFANGGKFEFAPGFHVSTSHVAHAPVPSRVGSFDWLVSPWRKVELTGALYLGENVSHLGTGGAGEGFHVAGAQQVTSLHSRGGWAQLTYIATDRLSFHLFHGRQDDRNRLLPAGQIGTNAAYGINFFYRLAPNFLMSVETSQVRTSYVDWGRRINNHYDLAFAYLF